MSNTQIIPQANDSREHVTASASAPPAAKGDAQRRATDAEIAEWLDRHDLRGTLPGSDARCAFEDAQSLCATVPTPPEPGSVAEDAVERDLRNALLLLSKATPGLLETIDVRNEGNYGDSGPDCRSGFRSYALVRDDGKSIADTLNSEVAVVHEDSDGDYLVAWDEVGSNDTAALAACWNFLRAHGAALTAAGTKPAEGGRVGGEAGDERLRLSAEVVALWHETSAKDERIPKEAIGLHHDAAELVRYLAARALTTPPAVRVNPEAAEALTFDAFRRANVARCMKWHPAGIASWSPSDWLTAITGELGELASLIKMRNRERDGLPGNKFSPTDKQIADELADVFTYLDLLAAALGVDLGRATVTKFNEVSERVGFPDRIVLATEA